MAVATPDIREALVAVRQSARAAERVAEGIGEKAGLVVLLLFVGLAIYIASRLPQDGTQDPVMRRLREAPIDDEPLTPDEEEQIRIARAEKSIPWDQAEQQLTEAD